jgi:polar amino acid transport system substrate-binding protein
MKVLNAFLVSGTLALASLTAALSHAAEMNVGANIGNVPWEFQDANGKIVGFEIDLMTEVGKRLGMDVKFTNIPFAGLFAAVQSGQIDAAVSSITITKKRLESVSFAQPYYDSDQSLTVKSDSGITGLSGMAGKIVGVDTGSTFRQAASTAISRTSRHCSIIPRTSRSSKSSRGSRPRNSTP